MALQLDGNDSLLNEINMAQQLEMTEEELEDAFRDNYTHILNQVNPVNVKDWLVQKDVINISDDEEIMSHSTTRAKNVTMMKIIERRGHEGRLVFLEAIGVEHPNVYRKITKKEPPTNPPENYYRPSALRRSKAFDDFLGQINSFLRARSKEEQTLLMQLEHVSNTAKMQEDRISHLEDERHELRTENANLHKSFGKFEENMSALLRQLDIKTDELEALKKKYEKLIEDSKYMESEMEKDKMQRSNLNKQSIKLKKELTELKKEQRQKLRHAGEFNSGTENADANSTPDHFLMQEINKERASREEIEKEKAALESQIIDLTQSVKDLESSNQHLQSLHTSTKDAHATTKAELKEVQLQNSHLLGDLGKQITMFVKNLNTVKFTVDSLEKSVTYALTTVLTDKQTYDDMKRKMLTFKSQVNVSSGELKDLEKDSDNFLNMSSLTQTAEKQLNTACGTHRSQTQDINQTYRRDETGAPVSIQLINSVCTMYKH